MPVVRLTEIFRQAAESRIVTNAHRVNQGLMPDLALAEGGDFYFVDAAEPKRVCASSWRSYRSGSRNVLGSTQYATSKCFAQ